MFTTFNSFLACVLITIGFISIPFHLYNLRISLFELIISSFWCLVKILENDSDNFFYKFHISNCKQNISIESFLITSFHLILLVPFVSLVTFLENISVVYLRFHRDCKFVTNVRCGDDLKCAVCYIKLLKTELQVRLYLIYIILFHSKNYI